jgi:hypothetical protein
MIKLKNYNIDDGYGDLEYIDCKVNWSGYDTEKLYKKNSRRNHDLIKSNDWLDAMTAITYEYNKWGFRTPEFTTTGGIMFLGCSYVSGVGLPSADTFSYIVSERAGLPMYRMGIGAGSNDAAFRVARHWIPKLQPKYVVMLQTFSNRMEMITARHLHKIMINFDDRYTDTAYYKDFVYNEKNTELLREKNCLAVHQLATSNNAKFITLDLNDPKFGELHNRDYARDLSHLGKKSNMLIAETVLNMMQDDKL